MTSDRTEEVRDKIARIISGCDDIPSLSFTTDLWTSRSQDSYISLTMAFLDKDFNLHRWVPEIRSFPERHTADNIVMELREMISGLDFNEEMLKFLTNDNASNVVLAGNNLENCKDLRCVCHTLQVRN